MTRLIRNEEETVEFLKNAKFVLRYDSTPALPLQSMYAAVGDQRRAIELTNFLLAQNEAIETNVIANRLVLIHRDVMPTLYKLRVRFRTETQSDNATRAFRLIKKHGSLSAGDVRRILGVSGMKRPDPADVALSELQKDILIDRGPSSVPERGIPYLSKEGFPYHVFETEHADIVKTAKKLHVDEAVDLLRKAASEIPARKFVSIFKLCLTSAEAREFRLEH